MHGPTQYAAKFAFLAVAFLSGAMAAGQAAPTAQRSASAQAGNDSNPAKPLNNNSAAQIGLMMGRSGGSLLKASFSIANDPGQAKYSQISYFAVAEKEPKTLKKHDLVTIVIREESSSSSKGQNDLKKNVELQAEVAQFFKINFSKLALKGLPTPAAEPGMDLTGARTFHGEGESDRTDSTTARITAEILDVKPNGTLVLQARKHIKIDDEEQQFILSGICRAEDIGPDNTVLSTQMYDLSFQKNSKGDVRQGTERGNLPKLLDFINPF
jgi:flagellar L-ring protein precursor FlgH